MNIYFDELYKYDRPDEHAFIGIPFAKGTVHTIDNYNIVQNGTIRPTQKKITAYWEDGSIKWGFFRFTADLPKCSKAVVSLETTENMSFDGIKITETNPYTVDTGALRFTLKNNSKSIFENVEFNGKTYNSSAFNGPVLKDGSDNVYDMLIYSWEITEPGPLVASFTGKGSNVCGSVKVDFEIYLTAYYGKSYVEFGYRIINTTDSELHIKNLQFDIITGADTFGMNYTVPQKGIDSTGCGDLIVTLENQEGPVFHTVGTGNMELFSDKLSTGSQRALVGASNYKTDFYARSDGGSISQIIDSNHIIKEANEHFAEVLYGTFLADSTDGTGGICATIYQAQQNFPKALLAGGGKISIFLVPDTSDKIVMQSGMSRCQKVLLHFHDKDTSMTELNNRSLIYQMPDRPFIDPEVYQKANVGVDVYVEKKAQIPIVERELISKADAHSRSYGMLNWGDAPDPGYTAQGRGNGEPVWTNNEYDFPHACALMYMRTGTRRFLDYALVAANHWMDVDICYYSKDPLRLYGQWEHTNGHCKNGTMVCSHEWVEGLLDYYHLTGDKRAYTCAINIGKNVSRLLETPMFKQCGEANARETGWALRTLVALYVETYDEKWLEKCEWIVGHFKEWEEEYGHWLAPYTDNTAIRVPFMISIAIGSLMRYYRIKPSDELKSMILRSIDDMVENCILDNGLFYYKGIPSLMRLGNNPLVLEALASAYELTGSSKYLEYGIPTFKFHMSGAIPSLGKKAKIGDAVITGNTGTKGFAQAFLPITLFYKALIDADMSDMI